MSMCCAVTQLPSRDSNVVRSIHVVHVGFMWRIRFRCKFSTAVFISSATHRGVLFGIKRKNSRREFWKLKWWFLVHSGNLVVIRRNSTYYYVIRSIAVKSTLVAVSWRWKGPNFIEFLTMFATTVITRDSVYLFWNVGKNSQATIMSCTLFAILVYTNIRVIVSFWETLNDYGLFKQYGTGTMIQRHD